MADLVTQHDIADLTASAPASALTSVTAGGAGNNTQATGLTIDRFQFGVALSIVFVLFAQAVLNAAGNTLSVTACKVEDSADGVNWATFQPGTTPVVTAPGAIATAAAAGTQQVTSRFGVSLRMARRYVRFDFTPVLSAANTDTAAIAVLATLAGFDRLPNPGNQT